MALPSDTYRKEQLLASLCRSDAPANTFTWGNLTTLKENVSDTTLYQSLHDFRRRHYSAHRMTVAIQVFCGQKVAKYRVFLFLIKHSVTGETANGSIGSVCVGLFF